MLDVAEDRGGSTVHCPCCGRPLCVPTLLPAGTVPGPAAGAPARAAGRKVLALAARALPVWRFGSPAGLLLALALFFLPWVEVRCDRPFGDRGTKTLADQSGLQAAYGGYTEAPLAPTARSERDRIEEQARALRGEVALSGSPLMTVYPLALLGGCLLGLLVRRGWV